MFQDKIHKETIIINRSIHEDEIDPTNITDLSEVSIELQDNIRNVVAIKHIQTHATINSSDTQNNPKFQNIFIQLNDYDLKKAYTKNNNIISCFANLIFDPVVTGQNNLRSFFSTKSDSTGIITDFDTDSDNYVFNPILPQLHKLNLKFLKEDGTKISPLEFTTEITIYTRNIKQTMF